MNRTIRNLRIRGMLPAATAVELDASSALLTKELTGGYDDDPNLGGAPAIIQNAELGTEFREETAAKFWRKTETVWEETGGGGGGSGDVTKVGTPADNQIGVWTGDGTIEGTTDFTWDGSRLIAKGGGVNSTAIGIGALSPQQGSIAIGGSSNATGSFTDQIAIGTNATASHARSIAVGLNSDSTNIDSVAIGHNTNALASSTVAIGSSASAPNTNGIAIGNSAFTTGNNGVSIGGQCNAGASGIAIGNSGTTASGSSSVAIGGSSLSSQAGGIAIGSSANSSHAGAIAIGINASSTAINRVTIGSGGTPIDLELFGGIGLNGATPLVAPSVTGSRGGNAALADLLTVLASMGLITDSTTA